MAGAVLALSGCGGDDDTPSTLPSATGGASESGSATDSETPSVTPSADSTAALQAELEAFFRDYTAAINESLVSKDGAERRRTFYSTSCTVCVRGQDNADELHSNGYTIRGGTTVLNSLTIDGAETDQATVRAVVSTAAGEVLDGERVVKTYVESSDTTIIFTLNKQPSGEWLIIQGEALT